MEKKVIYTESFLQAVNLSGGKNFFLGTGNPNSKILIVGKEAAIDTSKSDVQYELEIKKNSSDWQQNIKNKIQFEDIDNWFIKNRPPIYNPLYPYKGQHNKVERRFENGEIKGEGGTSKTWHNYQKIIDSIYFDNKASETINFHEYSFSSELNQVTGKYSHHIPKEERLESINKRKELFKESFFNDFTIVIVAVGHYVRDFNIDLQDLFEVRYDAVLSNKHSEGLNKDYINIHFDNLENPKKLVIHTNQLSMVSNELIYRLGLICKSFLTEIQLEN